MTVRYRGPAATYRPPLPDGHRNAVYAVWHHSLLLGVHRFRHQNLRAIVSRSKDGEHIARVAHEMGIKTTRGSTSRGGARALLELRQTTQEEDSDVVFTCDGPRGPRQTVQTGVLYLAQITGLPLVPAVYGLSSKWEVPSWDRFRIPKPFARALLAYGEPLRVPSDATREELEAVRQQLEASMRTMQDQADADVMDPKAGL